MQFLVGGLGALATFFFPKELFMHRVDAKKNWKIHFPSGIVEEFLPLPDLWSWAKEGSNLTFITAGARADGTRGLFVNRNLLKGEVIFELHPRYLLSPKVAMTCPWVQQAITRPDFPEDLIEVRPDIALAITLLYEKTQPRSNWRAYIDSLPKKASSITEPPEARMAYESIKESLDISWDEFWWAYSMVRSRRFAYPFQKKDVVSYYMFPVGDLTNHSDDPTAIPSAPNKFVAIRDLRSGDEITWNYIEQFPDVPASVVSQKFGIPMN